MTSRWVRGALLRLLAVAGLIVDAAVHLDLAPTQPPGGSGQLSQVTLFYAEGIVSIAVALLLLVSASRWSWLLAILVTATALAAVLQSRYVDIGSIGPVPDLYEPFWYASKVTAVVGEAVGFLASLGGILLARGHSWRGARVAAG